MNRLPDAELALARTRKTWPGGAVLRRLGLSEWLLVLPEHRVFLAAAGLPPRLAPA